MWRLITVCSEVMKLRMTHCCFLRGLLIYPFGYGCRLGSAFFLFLLRYTYSGPFPVHNPLSLSRGWHVNSLSLNLERGRFTFRKPGTHDEECWVKGRLLAPFRSAPVPFCPSRHQCRLWTTGTKIGPATDAEFSALARLPKSLKASSSSGALPSRFWGFSLTDETECWRQTRGTLEMSVAGRRCGHHGLR